MTLEQIVVIVLAAIALSAMFGGPVAAVIGFFLIRRSARKPWPVPAATKNHERSDES